MPKSNSHKDKPQELPTQPASSPVSQAMEGTKRAGLYAEEKAEQGTKALGAGMSSLSQTIYEHEPKEGVLHTVGEAVAGKLERGGHYLESQGLQGVGDDLTQLIRQHPIPALLIGVGVGLLLARMLKRA